MPKKGDSSFARKLEYFLWALQDDQLDFLNSFLFLLAPEADLIVEPFYKLSA